MHDSAAMKCKNMRITRCILHLWYTIKTPQLHRTIHSAWIRVYYGIKPGKSSTINLQYKAQQEQGYRPPQLWSVLEVNQTISAFFVLDLSTSTVQRSDRGLVDGGLVDGLFGRCLKSIGKFCVTDTQTDRQTEPRL